MSSNDQGRQLALCTEKQLYTGGDDPLLPALLNAIEQADEIEITVSFIQRSGLDLLFDALYDALIKGTTLKLLTSDYLDFTCPFALKELMTIQTLGADLRVYETRGNESFHMKSYIFTKTKGEDGQIYEGSAFIGSNNISAVALTQGLEWCFRHDFIASHSGNNKATFLQFKAAFASLFNHPQTTCLSYPWIQHYQKRRKKPQFKTVSKVDDDIDIEPISPRPEQQEALEKLNNSRAQSYKRGLVVLATGMGKTWLAAFDVQQVGAKKVLFVAHREEILKQAAKTFTRLIDCTAGFYTGKQKQSDADFLFASVQSIGKSESLSQFTADYFDYIIVDEFHHASSKLYRNLLSYFEPQFLLGLTATPERTDQADILSLCDNNLVYERNMVQGIDAKTLAPFHYYGIWDESVDYTAIPWRNGKFDPTSLSNQFATERRAKHALQHWKQLAQARTLAFCISTAHADYMANYFNKAGIKTASVHGKSSIKRSEALAHLASGKLQIIFSVDLFNEGTDLPCIDTVMMLRPSESKVLFLQQLGRGLRTHQQKTHLVVLDFIGNHHSFLNKPYALFGTYSLRDLVAKLSKDNQVVQLPEGCFVNYDLEITDFWQQLANEQRTTALDDYQNLAEQLGHAPDACEFFHEYGEFKKIKPYGSWFELVVKARSVSGISAEWLAPYKVFLKEAVEVTSMTKSFKAILLEAFVQLDGIAHPPTLRALADKSYDVLMHYPQLRKLDISEKDRSKSKGSKAWFNYWFDNPINAFTEAKKPAHKRKTHHWFSIEQAPNQSIEEAQFKLNLEVKTQDIEQLTDCILELSRYRLVRYLHTKLDRLAELESIQTVTDDAIPNQLQSTDVAENVVQLPYFPNLKIACGHFKTGDSSEMSFVPAPPGCGKVDPEKHFLAHASGNSMNGGKHPIFDGDLLLLERITSSNAGSITNTTIAIERFDSAGDEQFLLRDVRKQINAQGEVTYLLVARNPEYAVMEANDEFVTFARLREVLRLPEN
ncbi:DEAD/DEAH box helicase family protein [Pseudoalteromonas piscicida]|uniref:DEAD/DEAH box helicase n=1 Tax=Pseudoalteromonas piscicida TaxID=43662 RepID=A0AAD0RMU5_PSEO7|nr:DEAD/DEAH box helicase family protein [Pseudoalteromonas piscicida]ASD68947.1 DEAD/DEAH box helicase [Pseudoalteromonas piscicida]AXR04679.1 DEAD/DEAH box helicase [Pseudoalteromonas piscicida]